MSYYYTSIFNPIGKPEDEKDVLRLQQEFMGEMAIQLGMNKEELIYEDDIAFLDECLDHCTPEDVAYYAQEALKHILAEVVIIGEDFDGDAYGSSRVVIVADRAHHLVRYYGWEELISRTKADFYNPTIKF